MPARATEEPVQGVRWVGAVPAQPAEGSSDGLSVHNGITNGLFQTLELVSGLVLVTALELVSGLVLVTALELVSGLVLVAALFDPPDRPGRHNARVQTLRPKYLGACRRRMPTACG